MKIAITGSNGFLGRNFIKFSKQKNINILKLPSASGLKNYKKKENYEKISKILSKKKVKCLIHFAGIRKMECEKNYFYANKSIFGFTKKLVDTLKNNEEISLIYISSDHVYDGKASLVKEKNLKNLKPKTNLGILKLKSEKYLKLNLKKWSIIRLSAIMDDPRLSNFVIENLRKEKKIDLFTNLFFSPVLSNDLFKLIICILKKKKFNYVFHCSGNLRVSRYSFYTELLSKNRLLKKAKAKLSNLFPKDLSLSNEYTSKILNFKFTNFKRSIKISRNKLSIKY